MDGERAAGLEQSGDLRHRARGEDQRGGLADDAADRQNDAGQDAGHRARQHNTKHRAQTAGAQTERTLAEAVRHGHQRFLCGAHDERQDHDRQRHAARDQRIAPVQLGDKEQHAEQAVHDGRNAGERFGRNADDIDQLVAALCVLIQINRGKQAERHRDDQREQGHFDGGDDGRHHGDIVRIIGPLKQRGLEVRDAVDQNIRDQEQQRGKGDHRRAVYQALLHPRFSASVHLFGLFRSFYFGFFRSGCRFGRHAFFLLLSTEKHRLISRMNTNSTTPVAISASRCRPVA